MFLQDALRKACNRQVHKHESFLDLMNHESSDTTLMFCSRCTHWHIMTSATIDADLHEGAHPTVEYFLLVWKYDAWSKVIGSLATGVSQQDPHTYGHSGRCPMSPIATATPPHLSAAI